MILQIGPFAVSQAVEFGGQIANLLTGRRLGIFPGGQFTLAGFVVQEFQKLFKPGTPRLGSFQRGEVLKALQVAKITRDPLVRVADPFGPPQTLGIFRESQSEIAEQLFLEAALRREAAGRPPIVRERRPDFSRQRVSEIQAFFESLPTAEERVQQGVRFEPPPGSKRFRSRIAAGIRQRTAI